ncbi:DALR anticodon-binding domain-containing protein [Streptomyces sp. P9(2023)]|uniref:ArgS-related anticodon-binding protein NrtL n=1 Tax=Streptomyces sp. P9(2023) TaxID=3064394 RepID=UPI0028F45444|nr:DALR anticodon-binding domain-containing protein [Streptomyces sp. P9(2023)]MDT9689848.1 DALR anticodon-binding domain-containing protein [Streptomyces sp. P9(2023)]
MTPADLSLTVLHAVRRAVDDGALQVAAHDVPERIKVERPRPGGRGDYASNVALTLARAARRPPLDVAAILRDRLDRSPGLAAVDITGPGFLNFTLHTGAQQDLVREILERGPRYGWREPTGAVAQPTYRADVRAAVTADAVRRILVSQGYAVRTYCEDTADPDWTELGVRIEAQGARGRLATDIAPLPVPYTAAGLLDSLGLDAARWGLLASAAHDQARVGHELLRQHDDNPLFRVRYAHSRTHALTRNAAQTGFRGDASEPVENPDLLRALGDHPAVLAAAARHRAPDRVARHLEVVADALLDFQHTVLPLGDEKPSAAHRSRLALAEAAGVVLAGGLTLLGIRAPHEI